MEILVISRFAPYDSIGHAGGKTHNYYLKELASESKFNIRLVSFCDNNVKDKLTLDKYGISNSVIYIDDDIKHKIIRRIPDIIPLILNPEKGYELFGGKMRKMVLSKLKELKANMYEPDVIVLEWTQIVMIASEIKSIYPNAVLCASEHDVTFLSYERKMQFTSNFLKKVYRRRQYNAMKKKELKELEICSLIYTQSLKDSNLLVKNGINREKVFTIAPYYEDYSEISINRVTKDIIFFGAMDRAENYLSAVWFIENVLNRITDKDIKFIVIGNRPNEILQKYVSDRVIVTGFVSNDELQKYFSTCMCFVAPLVMGGGIKVKVLEAFSAAIPVLTNKIGIEGIPAVDGDSFFLCEEADEYLKIINDINNKKIDSKQIGINGRKVVKDNFSLSDSTTLLKQRICQQIY